MPGGKTIHLDLYVPRDQVEARLDPTTDLPELAQELLGHICGVALPEIKRLISDEGLRERQRLSKLETLLHAIGPVQHLSELSSDRALALDGQFDVLVIHVLRDAGFTEQPPH